MFFRNWVYHDRSLIPLMTWVGWNLTPWKPLILVLWDIPSRTKFHPRFWLLMMSVWHKISWVKEAKAESREGQIYIYITYLLKGYEGIYNMYINNTHIDLQAPKVCHEKGGLKKKHFFNPCFCLLRWELLNWCQWMQWQSLPFRFRGFQITSGPTNLLVIWR